MRPSHKLFPLLLILYLSAFDACSLTRWSTTHIIPDADLLEGGGFLIESQIYLSKDSKEDIFYKPTATLTLGLTEWVNIDAGYAGGFNLGLKARVLGETDTWVPSIAIGVRNVFSHKEAYYYDQSPDSLENELYLALGKSVNNLKIRFHGGILSIPGNRNEIINPFLGVEKYFGRGMYLTLEAHRRDKMLRPSAFINWRFLKNHFELSAGAVDISGMFSRKKTIDESDDAPGSQFVKSGVWVGLKFHGVMGIRKSDGFISLDERLSYQDKKIESLVKQVDSLKHVVNTGNNQLENINSAVTSILDSSVDGQAQIDFLALQKMVTLKALYSQEPFEPERARSLIQELVNYGGRVIPALSKMAQDRKEDLKLRTLATSILGEIGTKAAADALIEVLAQAHTPEMKIECLIGLGKIKETRAVYLMQELANDPDDAVSYTAHEVLQKLEQETGISLIKATDAEEVISVPESKIGADSNATIESNSGALSGEKFQEGKSSPVSNSSKTPVMVSPVPMKPDTIKQ